MNKLNQKSLVLALVIGAVSGISYWGMQHLPASQAEAEAAEPAARAPSDTIHFATDAPQLAFVRIKPVEAFPEPLIDGLNARVTYDDNFTARIFPSISGRVVKIAVEAGQHVKAGAPLLWMDSPDYAQGASDSLKAEADLANKKAVYERAKQLYAAQGIALKDMESAESDFHQAEAEAQRAKARMKNLGGNTVATAEGKFLLRAPVDGVVSERQVSIGTEVQPGAANPLLVITNLNHVWVLGELPEQQIGKIKVGQPVSIEVDAYPNEVFAGRVSVIGESLDPTLRRLQVRCDVDNSQHKLKPEMYARINPITDPNSKLPKVPNTALFTQGLYSYIFVEQAPGVLQRRRVTIGMQEADATYIKEGLRAGERIVTSGALLLNSELNSND
jgi:cobalt-zinc-cadmium efflux system membrane fusion protein